MLNNWNDLVFGIDYGYKETAMGYPNNNVRTTRTFAYEGNDLPTLFQLAALDLAAVKDSDSPANVYAELEGSTSGMYTLSIGL